MSRHGLLLRIVGVCAFGVALALLVTSQLTTEAARIIGLGVGIGVVVGALTGSAVSALLLRQMRPPQAGSGQPVDMPDGIFLTEEQASALFAILKNRRQTSPDDFPLRASQNREITLVGGATITDDE